MSLKTPDKKKNTRKLKIPDYMNRTHATDNKHPSHLPYNLPLPAVERADLVHFQPWVDAVQVECVL